MFQINSQNTKKNQKFLKILFFPRPSNRFTCFSFSPNEKYPWHYLVMYAQSWVIKSCMFFWGGYLEIPYFPLSSPKVQGVFQKVEATASFKILCL